MRALSYAAAPVLVGTLLLAGCAGSGSGAGSDTRSGASRTTPTGRVGPSPNTTPLPTTITTTPPTGDPTDPPLPKGRSRPITATGRVTLPHVEKGCTVMTISGQTYQLVGDEVGLLHDGQTVTVTGYADDSISTTCQVGVAFVVTRLATRGGR